VNGNGTGGGALFFVRFESGSFHAKLGCNDMNGEYGLRGGQLIPGVSRATERGCFDPQPGARDPMRFEEDGWEVLRRPMNMDMVGDLLSLSNRAGSLTLRRVG
jgi:heat shock protein HslJ